MSDEGKKTRHALTAAYQLSLKATSGIAGDIPSLIALAYQHHFDERMPRRSEKLAAFRRLIGIQATKDVPQDTNALESLISMLAEIPPLKPVAQALFDHARSILTSGPPLSMNIELADGEELPAALHTLNQGAVWACLMGGGANPDVDDRVLEEAQKAMVIGTGLQGKIEQILTSEAKCLWFLCRKFFFTMNVAGHDCESYQCTVNSSSYHHRMYMGRLFMLDSANHAAFTRATMPRALEVYSNTFAHIAMTPKGLWGWGLSFGQLGFESHEFVDPTRLTFPACPKIAELEASLPAWEKHRMVTDLSMQFGQTFILTPAGTTMAGAFAPRFTGPVEDEYLFNHVLTPAGFVPHHIMHMVDIVILTMGDRQVISGVNFCGQLGLGHENVMVGFEEIHFGVDRIVASSPNWHIYLSGRQLLFAGLVDAHTTRFDLLPGLSEGMLCSTATPLQFSERVKGLWGCVRLLVMFGGDELAHRPFIIPFEATALSTADGVCFCDDAGQWFRVKRQSGGVAKMARAGAREECECVVPVDIEPGDDVR
ncbi:hypothetical protein J8273_3742 [Carpediemonas membranifera]|uniref:Uncharacterized protein n=1 Tax=Carpediemonas membranifera TaxID=201153 RepID=A0A8J6E2U8_9EUKA|nr:hypothetical protein J8273_3742 [Carpediemonas membranifera]|eukprot:KAG9394766.1 hypothetical protein J8273_3742 [Carpediemonas membranifera]